MTALLQGTGCTYVVREKHIVISKIQATAQQTRKNVTGNVTDQQGEPIIGATIVVKDNPSRGTVTDIDGNFYLTNIADDAVLHVSYVGMKLQEVSTLGKIFHFWELRQPPSQ